MELNTQQKKSIDFTPKEQVYLTCLCGQKKFIEYFDPYKKTKRFEGYKLVECTSCSLVRTDPSPISCLDDAKELYDDPNYYAESADQTNFWLKMAKRTIQDLSKIDVKGKLLDIGCGLGYIVKAAEDLGFKASGIDLNPHPIPIGKKKFGVNIARKTLEEVVEKYDVITSNHVLEHVLSPKDFLAQIEERLNPGGYLLLGVPNINGGIPRTLRLLNYLNRGPGANWLWVGYQPNEHIWHFTPQTLMSFLEKEGWEVKKVRVNLNNSYAYIKFPKFHQRIIQKLWRIFEFFNMADEFTVLCQKKK